MAKANPHTKEMMRLALVLCALFYFVAHQMQACNGCLEKERRGLLEIKSYLLSQGDDVAKSELASWVDDRASNCCSWNRVKCSNISTGSVADLSLHRLTSHEKLWKLNVSLFRPFEELLRLDLSRNSFKSWIHNEDFKKLRKLTVLDLSYNHLNNSIEGLCSMKGLVELDLNHNMLSGQLPECLGNLTNLQVLDLSNNPFSGNFPSFISNLTSLVYLSLFGNYLQGSFSLSTLANHSKLQVLYVSSQSSRAQVETESSLWFPTFQLSSLVIRSCNLNKDQGSAIPSFLFHQHDIQVIDLSHNRLHGAFPSWLIQNNSRLVTFILMNNSFGGSMQLHSITHDMNYIDVSNNKVSGFLQKDFGAFLPRIITLNLSMNNFEGSIPASFGEMKELKILDLSQNHFSSVLPEELVTGCIKLETLKLSNNFFKGNVPTSFQSARLARLYLSNNNFSGTLEEVLANHVKLNELDLSKNSISGAIPSSIGKFVCMRILLMAENKLEGEIPFEFSNMSNLLIVDISQNKLSGPIAHFKLSSMIYLYLQKNALSGNIPFSLAESSKLVVLDLRDNNFSGNVPGWMDKLSRLQVLLLGGNKLHGQIPIQLCKLIHITIMDLSRNMINGTIPSCFTNLSFGMGRYQAEDLDILYEIPSRYLLREPSINASVSVFNPTNNISFDDVLATAEFRTKNNYYSYKGNIIENMTGLDLSCNEISGIIPYQIGNLQQIRALNLSHNYLSGSIPKAFSNLTQVESLDLSFNKLSGRIPFELTQLNFLSIFNVSYNNLSGIPPIAGQFANFDEENYKGNPDLCGPLLKHKCVIASSPSEFNSTEEMEANVDMVALYWSFTSSYIMILLGFIMVLWINPYWRMAWFNFIGKVIHTCFPSFPLY